MSTASEPLESHEASPWREFLRGVAAPSLPASAGILTVALLVAALAVTGITPALLARLGPGYLMRDASDNRAFVTARALQLRAAPRDPDAIAILGTSTTLHALTPDDVLQQTFAAEFGRPVAVHNLCAAAVGFPEYLQIMETLDDRVGGWVVLNVSMVHLMLAPNLWADREEQSRLGLPSQDLEAELQRRAVPLQRRSGNYFLDQHKFLASRLLSLAWHLATGPLEPTRYITLERIAGSLRVFRQRLELAQDRRRQEFEDNARGNLETLARLIAAIRARSGAEVVLLEGTLNPQVRREVDLSRYQELITGFAAAEGVHYLNLDAGARLGPRHFADYGHLHDAGARQRYTERLAVRLAGWDRRR